jgi:methylated-DNA-protein-cysteine methyltransferase-like protein
LVKVPFFSSGLVYRLTIVLAALKLLPPDSNAHALIPWHRVISAKGSISSRGPGTVGARRQRDALVHEGVEVVERAGEFRVDLGRFGWFPSVGEVKGMQEAEAEG